MPRLSAAGRVRESAAVPPRPRSAPGLFVTFEGIEGSGKTTQLRLLAEALGRRGTPALATREPGATPLGAEIRRLVLDAAHPVDPAAELLLVFADRRQHLVEEILPALSRGDVVLCDRYTDASRAYQGAGRRLGEAAVNALHSRFCRLQPARTYLFDCEPALALSRLAARATRGVRDGRDRIEREGLEFHRRVRGAYRRLAAREPRRFRVLDASASPEAVHAAVLSDFERLLSRRARRP